MRYLVYVTDNALENARSLGMTSILQKEVEKIKTIQSIGTWYHATLNHRHIIKKYYAKRRIIAYTRYFPEDHTTVVCIIAILVRSSAAYVQNFTHYKTDVPNPEPFCQQFLPPDDVLRQYIAGQLNSVLPLRPPDGIEYEFLIKATSSEDYGAVFLESDYWYEQTLTKVFHSHYRHHFYDLVYRSINTREEYRDNHYQILEVTKESGKLRYKLLYAILESGDIYLIAPLVRQSEEEEDRIREQYAPKLDAISGIMDEKQQRNEVSRFSRRCYPQLMLIEEAWWYDIEENAAGNLALSDEENSILRSVLDIHSQPRFPLFINGRPGSGKTTILQYLFATYIHFYLHALFKGYFGEINESGNYSEIKPPLYLTYSPELLESARNATRQILAFNSEHNIQISGDADFKLDDPLVDDVLERSFAEFHSFLLSLLPEDMQRQFPADKRIDYARFRQLWHAHSQRHPSPQIRKLSPEIVWHVIRTYIKGMSGSSDPQDNGDYLDFEDYEELPREQKTVTTETYKLVYGIWESWYTSLSREGYWDTQDLARTLLNYSDLELARYPVIFCDEAQDFTSVEQELILQLSLYTRRQVDPNHLKHVPFAFAGDPYQTLNPTGFNWEALKARFHERILQALDHTGRAKLDFNYHELSFNYRSTNNIVKLCNLIQLVRGILFGAKVNPQKTWQDDPDSPMPVYFNIADPNTLQQLKSQQELVIILPCYEGEEMAYVAQDADLRQIVINDDDSPRNFLSAMSAKGLEFQRVALYKFGDECHRLYPALFNPLEKRSYGRINEETLLPYQYFINRLYVAASRAKRRLIIVDTTEGIKQMWTRQSLGQFEKLLSFYPNPEASWSDSDLQYVQEGIPTSWEDDRDNPLEIAEALYRGGEENDPYRLKLAAANFRRAGQETKAKACDARRLEIEGDYEKAGLVYVEINQPDKARDCWWRSHAYKHLMNETSFINMPEQRAAHFMLSKRRPADCTNFLDFLYQEMQGTNSKSLVADPRWREIVSELVKSLANLHSGSKLDWKTIHAQLSIIHERGLSFPNSSEWAEIALRAQEYSHAAALLETLGINDHRYKDARARSQPYPANLRWYWETRSYQHIIDLYKTHQDVKLNDNDAEIVITAHIAERQHEQLIELFTQYRQAGQFSKWFQSLRDLRRLPLSLAEQLIPLFILYEKWSEALNFVKKSRVSETDRTTLHAAFIGQIARRFSTAHSARSEIGDYLREMLLDTSWTNLVSITIAGAAFERAGKLKDCLPFYEQVWEKAMIPATPEEIQFARERWLKCKQKLQMRRDTRTGPRPRIGTVDEVEKFSKEWGIDLSKLPPYPVVDEKASSRPILTDAKRQAILMLGQNNMPPSLIAEALTLTVDEVEHVLNGKD